MHLSGYKRTGPLTCALTLLSVQGIGSEILLSRDNDPSTPDMRPNVLIILTDDQGWGDVSYTGTKDIRTPNIDLLASDGIRFSNFYANCPVSSPTRAALLTGRYQEYVGVPGVIRTHKENSWGFFSPRAITLADKFSENGYHTALIGKWHLGLESPNMPNERGFQYFKGFLGDMMDDFYRHLRHGKNYMRLNDREITPEGHATDLFTEWAVEYIHSREGFPSPFFLFLSHCAPHVPVQPPVEWLEKVHGRESGISDTRARLVAFIEHLDHGIGRVVDALKEAGMYDNTIIVFTSDNGGHLPDEANNGPFRNGKQSVYEGGLRVPALMVWKDLIGPGTVTGYKAMSMDLYPTLLEACGISYAHPIEGISFLPLLKGGSMDDSERVMFFSRREGGVNYGGLTIQAVQWNNWKLLQNSPFAPMELYNLKDDPYERNNLILSQPEVRKKLSGWLMRHIQKGGQVPWQGTEQ